MRIKVGDNQRDIVLISAYLPSNSQTLPPTQEFVNVISFCEQRNLSVLIGADVNARHASWGSRINNARGDSLANYLAATQLAIVNQGNDPTFVAGTRSSCIDVTLASPDLLALVDAWHVSPEDSLSDHRYIMCRIRSGTLPWKRCRNPRKTNWRLYSTVLEGLIGGRMAPISSQEDIENEVAVLTSAIQTAYEMACPLPNDNLPCKKRRCPWWNGELTSMRARVSRLFHRSLRSKSQRDHEEYVIEKNKYKAEI